MRRVGKIVLGDNVTRVCHLVGAVEVPSQHRTDAGRRRCSSGISLHPSEPDLKMHLRRLRESRRGLQNSRRGVVCGRS